LKLSAWSQTNCFGLDHTSAHRPTISAGAHNCLDRRHGATVLSPTFVRRQLSVDSDFTVQRLLARRFSAPLQAWSAGAGWLPDVENFLNPPVLRGAGSVAL
jgi:hypothetical protein